MYVTVLNGRLPSLASYDFKGEQWGPDLINVTSNEKAFTSQRAVGFKVLFRVAIRNPTNKKVDYRLFNWGPTAFNESVFNAEDMELNKQVNFTFQPRNVREGQYKIYRYLNYGVRDFKFTISST